MPEHLRPQLDIIIGAAAAFAEQHAQKQQKPSDPPPQPQHPQGGRIGDGAGTDAVGTAAAATATTTAEEVPTDAGDGAASVDDMGDLDQNTIEMLDEIYEAAQPAPAQMDGKPAAGVPPEDRAKRRATMLAVMGKRGAIPTRRGVLRDGEGKVKGVAGTVAHGTAPGAGAEDL